MAFHRRPSAPRRVALALFALCLVPALSAEAADDGSATLDSFNTPKPALNFEVPTVNDCASKALIQRKTENCFPRELTNGELVSRTIRDKKLEGLALVENTGLFTSPTFTMASYNVLGASHTDGPKANKPQFPPSPGRMSDSVSLIRQSGLSLAGLQEFQGGQYQQFKRLLPTWEGYPGLEIESYAVQNSVVWDTTVWTRLEAQTISIPYFGGKPFKMPYVLLQHRVTGRLIWLANFHNPANVRGNADALRAEATRREAELALSLNADKIPTFFTGDMNDRDEFICSFTSVAPQMHASNGGKRNEDGTCYAGNPLNIDWITGSAEVTFSNHVADRSTEAQKMSDHPMIRADATIAPALKQERCEGIAVGGKSLWFCPEAMLARVQPQELLPPS